MNTSRQHFGHYAPTLVAHLGLHHTCLEGTMGPSLFRCWSSTCSQQVSAKKEADQQANSTAYLVPGFDQRSRLCVRLTHGVRHCHVKQPFQLLEARLIDLPAEGLAVRHVSMISVQYLRQIKEFIPVLSFDHTDSALHRAPCPPALSPLHHARALHFSTSLQRGHLHIAANITGPHTRLWLLLLTKLSMIGTWDAVQRCLRLAHSMVRPLSSVKKTLVVLTFAEIAWQQPVSLLAVQSAARG